MGVVTLNRVKSPIYKPKTICGIVYQKAQFSWTSNKRLIKRKKDAKQWSHSVKAANEVLNKDKPLGNFHATHFHATYVRNPWKLHRVAKIGDHIFYK